MVDRVCELRNTVRLYCKVRTRMQLFLSSGRSSRPLAETLVRCTRQSDPGDRRLETDRDDPSGYCKKAVLAAFTLQPGEQPGDENKDHVQVHDFHATYCSSLCPKCLLYVMYFRSGTRDVVRWPCRVAQEKTRHGDYALRTENRPRYLLYCLHERVTSYHVIRDLIVIQIIL